MANIEIPQPYPGIRPFKERDWPIFFGREAQSNQLLHKLETTRFVAVVGSSGSGKSSLVRAGLIPLIRQGFLRNITDWAVLLCRPGVDPFSGLAYEISQLDRPQSAEDGSEIQAASVTSSLIAAELRASANGVVSVLEKLDLPHTRHILLIVDQFEEIFGFRSSWTAENSASRGEAERFVDCVLQSCAADVTSPLTTGAANLPQRIWVLLTMRSDFIGHCEVFPALARCVSDSQFLVPVLNSEQKKEAIIRPGEIERIEGATYGAFDFDEGVVSVVVNETGDRLDQLPLMQHALMRTWKLAKIRSDEAKTPVRIELDDYKTAGRIEEALHNDAENAWQEIASDQNLARITKQMFLLLCDISDEGKLTRKRPKASFVMAATGARLEELEAILGVFQRDDRNFLRPAVVPLTDRRLVADDALDVSHEALVRQWRTYRSWQIDERRNIEELIDLKRRAELHKQKREPLLGRMTLDRLKKWEVNKTWASNYISTADWEAIQGLIRQSKRKQKWLISSVIVGITVILSLAVWAFLLWSKQDVLMAQNKLAAKERNFEKDRAEKQQALRLNTSIGSLEKEPSLDEVSALWELAQLPVESENVRTHVIEQWFDSESLGRPLARNGQGLKAALGTAPTRLALLRKHVISHTSRIANGKADGETWLALSPSLNPASAKEAAEKLVHEMELRDVEGARLANLGTALAGLLETAAFDNARMLARRGATVLAGAMEKAQEIDPSRLSALGNSLAKLIRLDAAEETQVLASIGATAVTKSLGKITSEDIRLSSSASAPSQTTKTSKSTEGSTDAGPLLSLGNTLAALTKVMKQAKAEEEAASGAKPLVDAILNTREADGDPRLFRWASAVAELTKVMKPEDREKTAKTVAGFLAGAVAQQTRNSEGTIKDRWAIIVELVRGMNSEDRTAFIQRLVTDIKNSPGTSTKLNLSVGLTQIAPLIGSEKTADAAREAAGSIIEALEQTEKPPPKKETETSHRIRLTTSAYAAADLATALAELAKVMRPKEKASLLERAVSALLERQMYEQWKSADALVELTKAANKEEIPALALRLAVAMEHSGQDVTSLWTLGTALADMATRVEPDMVAEAKRRASLVLIKALESSRRTETEAVDLLLFAIALSKLQETTQPAESTPFIQRAAAVIVEALEKPRKGEIDAAGFSNLVWSLFQLNKKMRPEDAAKIVERAIGLIGKAMDDAEKTAFDAKQLASLGLAVSDLCKMIRKPEQAALLASRASAILLKAKGANASERAKLGETLLSLVIFLPGARMTENFALYERMSVAIPPKPPGTDKDSEDRQIVIRAYDKCDRQQLAEILKWPFCVGEVQKMALMAMEKLTTRRFNDNVWTFVDQASDLGIGNLDGPAEYPSADKATQELAQILSTPVNPK